MKKINKRNTITFVILLITTCIIFGPLLKGHYATDTYNIYNVGYYTYATRNSLNDGRILMGIIGLIANKINIPIQIYSTITLFGAIVISNIAVMLLKKIIEKYKPTQNIFSQIIITVISYITIFNFMYLDNLYFVENIVMALSILLFIKSADILVEKNNQYLLKSTILTILGVLCYQGTIGLYFAYVLLFSILKNNKNIKNIIKDIVKSGIIASIAIVVDLIIVKIIGNILGTKQTRYGKLSSIIKNITYIFKTLPFILGETCYMFPKGAFIIFVFVLGCLFLTYIIKNKKDNVLIYQFLAIILVTIASAYIINLTTLTSFETGRLKNSIGALIGILFIFMYVQTDIFDSKTYLKNISIITLLVFTIINVVSYENIILQHKKVNILEKKEADKIEEYIEQYENETDIKVTKIVKVIVKSDNSEGFFDEVKNKSDYTKNAIRTDWGIKGVLELAENRRLEERKATKQEKEEYLNTQPKELGYECIGDTFFINIYNY